MVALSAAKCSGCVEVVAIPPELLSSLEVVPLGPVLVIVDVSSVFGRVESESTWKPGNVFILENCNSVFFFNLIGSLSSPGK